MAYLELYRERLRKNFDYLNTQMKDQGKEWAIVTKLLCGNREYLKEVIDLGIKEVCDSRVSNLKAIKELDPSVQTVYIKPVAKKSIKSMVKYADASFNTELETIRLISEEAGRQGKVHKIIIMIELGDLREGVMGDELVDFYGDIFDLPNIKVTGIGTNLNCLNGVLPSQDKLIQLSLYEQLIEAKFNRKIPWVTGGTSIILPLLDMHQVPDGVNHFRIGESLYFGRNLLNDEPVEGMDQDVIRLFAQIIEIHEKPKVPIGYLAENPSGESFDVDESEYGQTSYRAILDIGLLDINTDYLIPKDEGLSFIGASSDMVVVDLGDSPGKYKVGDILSFGLKYMGALTLLNSDYISKKVV